MIDLHIHLLPGIDDGPPDDAGAVELARAVSAAGTTAVAVTPHVDFKHQVAVSELPRRLEALRALLAEHGVPLELHKGGEVAPTRLQELDDEELEIVTLGSGRTVLLEAPFSDAHDFVKQAVFALQSRGRSVLLAHPERSPSYIGKPDRVAELTDRGVMIQVTTGAMSGRFGGTVQRFAYSLFENGLVTVVSSDAHDLERRRPGSSRAFAAAEQALPGIEQHAGYWTVDAPAAIVEGRQPGPPPPVEAARGLLSRLRRRR